MNNWKLIPSIVLATVLIFGAGVFTGGFLVHYVKLKPEAVKKSSPPENHAPVSSTNCSPSSTNLVVKSPSSPQEILSKPFLIKLDEQLRLNGDQHKAIEKIINDGSDEMKKVVRDARLEIREVLTPEQLKQFDALMKPAAKKKPSAIPATNAPVPPPATNAP